MSEKLRILILEDVPNDAELAERELHGAGLTLDSRRVAAFRRHRRTDDPIGGLRKTGGL